MYPLYRFFWLTICVAIRFTNGGWLDTEVKDWPATGRRICMDAAWNKPEEIVGMETGCLDYGKSFTGPWIGPAVGERELAVDFESGTDTNAYWMLRGDIRPPKDGPPQLDLGQVYQDYLVSIYALPNVMDSKRYWFPGCLTAWQNPDAYKEGDRWDGNSKQALGVVYLENCNPGNPQQDFVWRISNELDSLKGPNDTRIDLRRYSLITLLLTTALAGAAALLQPDADDRPTLAPESYEDRIKFPELGKWWLGVRICLEPDFNPGLQLPESNFGCLWTGVRIGGSPDPFLSTWSFNTTAEERLRNIEELVDAEITKIHNRGGWRARGTRRLPSPAFRNPEPGYEHYLVQIQNLATFEYQFDHCLTWWEPPAELLDSPWDGAGDKAYGLVYVTKCDATSAQQRFIIQAKYEVLPVKAGGQPTPEEVNQLLTE
ncbi:hypothetical protein Dda_7190 [Drechslerella dactyloides]|uniref:Uncharacterized protein n=1 Tax=Drechslerella dactyloides TaxID=74499 RepID=A0AAD6IX06_DREDA|nr:hypothetical protein Dda_7190 [Drechslerella dactyloides]